MQYRQLGQTGIAISAIIFGGWQAGKTGRFGGWVGIEDRETLAAHRAAFEQGVTTFDTAESYGEGHGEQILAQALGDKRDQIQILTKVAAHHLRHDLVIQACERSLHNLKTDRIDLYQIHWPSGTWDSPVIAVGETMGALNALKAQGKIRAIGVSNFSKAQLQEAAQFGPIESLQPPYSLFTRQIERETRDYCQQQTLSILAYSPLARGLLTGRFVRGHAFAEEDNRRHYELFQGRTFDLALNALDKLRPFAAHYGVTLGQLALAWTIAQPQTSAIVGARNATQAIENARAADIAIAADDLEAIGASGLPVFAALHSEAQ